MIVEWLLSLGANVGIWLSSFVPTFDAVNGVVIPANSFMFALIQGIGSLGVWIPFQTIGTCVGIALNLYLVSFAFRIVRVVLGHVPLFGGNG